MDTAHELDAVLNSKFYFRKSVMNPCQKLKVKLYHSTSPEIRETEVSSDILEGLSLPSEAEAAADPNAYGLLSINEIMNGAADGGYPGLLPLIHAYLDLIECTGPTRDVLNCYLDLIRLRATGELATAAHWARNFLTTHAEYEKDSIITDKMHNDLVDAFVGITDGSVVPPELLGRLNRRMQSILARLQEDTPAKGAAGVTVGSDDESESWDASANQRWQDILARIQAEASDEMLRGASLNCD